MGLCQIQASWELQGMGGENTPHYCWSKDMYTRVCSLGSQAQVVHSFPLVFFTAYLEMPYTNTVSLCLGSWSCGILPGTGSVQLCKALG